jgi:uncharacterized membrane protein
MMSEDLILTAVAVLSRWIHVGTAIVVLGGSVFLRFVLQPAAEKLPDEAHQALRANVLRTWKFFVHIGIVLFLVSGFYNYLVVAMPLHRRDYLYHALLGIKILLAVVVFLLAEALVGRSPAFEKIRQQRKLWLGIVILLAAIIVAISGYVKVRGAAPITAGRTTVLQDK